MYVSVCVWVFFTTCFNLNRVQIIQVLVSSPLLFLHFVRIIYFKITLAYKWYSSLYKTMLLYTRSSLTFARSFLSFPNIPVSFSRFLKVNIFFRLFVANLAFSLLTQTSHGKEKILADEKAQPRLWRTFRVSLVLLVLLKFLMSNVYSFFFFFFFFFIIRVIRVKVSVQTCVSRARFLNLLILFGIFGCRESQFLIFFSLILGKTITNLTLIQLKSFFRTLCEY